MFVDTPLEVCELRDVKGLYKKARQGTIQGFTGVTQAYEAPESPDLIVKTEGLSVKDSTRKIIELLEREMIIPQSLRAAIEQVDASPALTEKRVVVAAHGAASKMPSLSISTVELQWLQVLAEGWAYPQMGFMKEAEYLQTLHFNCILNEDESHRDNQSVPIVLSATALDKERLEGASEISLVYNDQPVAYLKQPEFYLQRKEERVARQFGTTHKDHPYIKMILESGEYLVGGEVYLLQKISWNDGLDQYRLTPNELRKRFAEMGADAVFAFQLRNPIHNGHALLMQDCRRQLLERGYKNPVLLLHPLGGWTKDDDVPLDVRMAQHQAVLDAGVLDRKHTVLAIFPSPMMYAGPTEVQWHAKARMNAGAQFYIVGRDPAGMAHPDPEVYADKNLYDGTHGAQVLKMAPGLDQIVVGGICCWED